MISYMLIYVSVLCSPWEGDKYWRFLTKKPSKLLLSGIEMINAICNFFIPTPSSLSFYLISAKNRHFCKHICLKQLDMYLYNVGNWNWFYFVLHPNINLLYREMACGTNIASDRHTKAHTQCTHMNFAPS